MTTRFFHPDLPDAGSITLDAAESHHLLHVMRFGPGANVVLFDGFGGEADGVVTSTARRTATVEIHARRTINEPASGLTIAMPLPKGDRAKWLLEKLTELGVDVLVPLSTERTVVEPSTTKRDKLQQHVIAACKQCGRSRLLQIGAPSSIADQIHTADTTSSRILLADVHGRPCREFAWSHLTPTVLFVGPEGGFTASEVEQFEAGGSTRVSFGAFILRMETAAVAGAAVLCGAVLCRADSHE